MKLNLLASCCTALLMSIAISAPVLGQPAPQGLDESNPEGRFIVQFRDFRGASAVIRAAGGNPVLELGPQSAVAAYLPPKAIEALSRNPNIEWIEQDARRYPMAQVKPYGVGMVQADQVSDSAAGNTTVCVIDSGYDSGHPDLQSINVSPTSNTDTCAHGTHVAGTIAALANNTGVVGVMGSGNINLRIEKVFDGAGCAWSYASGLVGALNSCIANKKLNTNLVVNMSLGGGLSSRTESNAFASAYSSNVLSIAAAGNDGNNRNSYPASYSSVVSVAAVDSAGVVAPFSQYNSQVELAAPGVAVRSTVPRGMGLDESFAVGLAGYEAIAMDGSYSASASGALVDCGFGGAPCAGAVGKVCLISRGENISFADKVLNCQAGGGVAAVIYNNVPGVISGTLNGVATTVPSVGISQADGLALASGGIGQSASVSVGIGDYAYFDGTSMATPHVAGVAALIWSQHPTRTNAQVRSAMQSTALDKGAPGRDVNYGYGIVQAKAALDALAAAGGGGGGILTITLAARVVKPRNAPKYVELQWSGAGGTQVDLRRNGTFIRAVTNDGAENDTPATAGTYRYQICEQSPSTKCSGEVSVKF